jgi:hypothetical protein
MEQTDTYPVQFDIDYPDRPLNRLSTFFRFILVIPIIVLFAAGIPALLFPPLLMILFRQKYPRWWFDYNVALLRFSARVMVYIALMRDEYPSTDEEQSVHLEVPYPDVESELGRLLPLFKWILAIPHYIVLSFLAVAALVVIIVAWFAILFTGRYPRYLFNFMIGFQRWANRVGVYAFTLTTDQYPPFRLSP